MRAAVYRKPHEMEIEERPVPELGPRDVLVEVSHCGICGTDLHVVLEGMGRPGSIGGHEWSGRIAAVGADVTRWTAGEPVIGGASLRCGTCAYCRAGRPSLCAERPGVGVSDWQGAFAEYVKAHEDEVLRVPAGLDLRTAALTEPLAVALHALTLSRVAPGQRALVTGAGPIGLLCVAALRARGIEEVSVSEPVASRLERAGRVGATELLGPDALETPVMPFAVVDAPYDVAFECSGNPAAMEAALGQLARAGTLVLVGTGMRRPKLDHNRILLNELLVTGAFTYDAGGFESALELLAGGALPVRELIEADDVPLAGLLDAIERLGAGELDAKVMIAPGRVSRGPSAAPKPL